MLKTYTYSVHCTVVIQYSFAETEVQLDDDREIEPKENALRELEREIGATIGEKFPVTSIEIYADADTLLGEEDHA